ncbi:hypothetical protein [Novosphingobium sp. CF614]|uniref:hypothetical protein n=1 Tax=Novosphingobium sp. CF614 TaxID=1884364 RepID=UPI001C4351F0|nr:hypothetical protein [Novosphingobium sp. CF614]
MQAAEVRSGWAAARWWPLLVVLAVVPLLYPAVPPLTDLPAHMSRIMVQMDDGRSADITRWYGFEWNLIPNLGTDLLAWVIEPLLGLEPTMKAIAMLVVAMQAAGYLLLSRAAHGRVTATALFALPLAYGNPFQYGFLNFTFAVALATLALALWITPRMAARPVLRWFIFGAVACAVWISHLAGWAVLCLLVGCCELAARYEQTGNLRRALPGGFVASSCLLLPQILSLLWPHSPEHLPTQGFFLVAEKLYFLVNVLADRWTAFDNFCAFALFVLIVFTWRSKATALHKGLALGAIVLFGVFWLLPGWIYGSYYADMRMTPTIFALALIAARPRLASRHMAWLALAGLAFFGVRLAGTTLSMAMWDRQLKQELAVLDSLPRGAQLVSFSALPCRTFVLQGRVRDMHIASYALTRRHAFANDQFAMSGGQLLRIHNPAAGAFDRDPSTIEIGESCNDATPLLDSAAKVPAAIPYLWIVWHTPELPVPGWRVLARSGGSVLYQRVR